ncbi:chorismate mutase family protein [Kutzneria kofuensis]|uniref:Prephenate dehydrogenase n=1 Tax=Kutzneria kofuensis TaxID=103725 RepID=A0A7W9KC75_9PSEU|nr:chorismate mutase family protein [Kutzneria kofuensis]MBB5889907.1 prephenate dehydrogenase [Kutzneria kofuensis]
MTALRRAVVVGGRGTVGTMLTDLLRGSGIATTAIDPVPGDGDAVRGDITAPDAGIAAAVMAADLVVLAVPEPVALRALEPLAPLLRPGAVLADTLSVKSRFAARLGDLPATVEQVGLNPMFAPDLGMAGRPVAAVVTRGGPGVTAVLDMVRSWGGRVVPCNPEEHDTTTAATQALTHAAVLSFGLALTRLGVDAERLAATAPPPHTTLLALLARITGGSPEVYLDVQAANPHAPAARQALADGLRAFATAVEGGELTAVFDQVRAWFGTGFEAYRRRGRELSTTTHTGEIPMSEHRLSDLRAELDRLDQVLLDTIRRRLECGVQIAEHKAANDVPMMQPARVALVTDRAAGYGREHGVDPAFLVRMYELIIAEMCRVEDLVIAQAAGVR